jgi:hypothetical protein
LRDLTVGGQDIAVRLEGERILPLDDAGGMLRQVKRRWDAPGCV